MGNFFSKKISTHEYTKGFTLAEMLITIGIIVLMSTVVLFNYGSFNSDLAVTNLAYDIALTIRQAEYYGIGAKSQGGSFSLAYGVHFNTTTGANTTYTIYTTDASGPSAYAGTGIQSFTLNNGNYIAGVKSIDSCSSNISSADVVFVRPLPTVSFFDGSSKITPSGIEVAITSTRVGARTMYVKILSSGQIGVSKTSVCVTP